MSIRIDELAELLHEIQVEKETANEIIRKAEKLEQEKKEEREGNGTKSKNKLTVLIRGDDNIEKLVEQAWVVKTPLDQDDSDLIYRIRKAVTRHNIAQRKEVNKLKTFSDFFNFVKRKFTKEYDVNISVQTKEPVRVVVLKDSEVEPLTDDA